MPQYTQKGWRMRGDAMEALSAVNRWVETARGLLAKQLQLPLIDNSDIDMHAALWDALEYGDDRLRAAIDNVLSRDPDELAARFVALNFYYRLMGTEIPEQFRCADGFDQFNRKDILNHLGYLVRLRDPATCADTINIRWEIVNASAVKDYSRMLALCDQLDNIVPAGKRCYLRGRVHSLIAVLHTWDIEVESLELWDLPLGPETDGPRGEWRWINAGILISAGIQRFPVRGALTGDDRDHLRDATKFLEKAIGSESDVLATTRLMLARSYASIDDGGNAARQYQWMADHRDAFLRSCKDEEGPIWDDDSQKEMISAGIHACLVNAYDGAGERDKAIGAAEVV